MDQVTWLELLGRHNDVVRRERIAAPSVTIGRAYDNDIVLDDPHVAAHHLRVARGEDGRWVAEDLGSLNGLQVDGEHTRRAQSVLTPASVLRIGQTTLRLRRAGDDVAAEMPLVHAVPRWPLALAFIAGVLGLELLGVWLTETGEAKVIRYLTPLLTVAVVIAAWTTLWALLSRLFSAHARLGQHLLIAGAGLFAFSLYQQLCELGAFALSWPALSRSVYVIGWLIFAAICFAHLRVLGRTRLLLQAGAVIAIAALGVTMQTLKQSEWRSNYGVALTLQRLQPPSLRIAGAESEAAFFTGNDALRVKLDKARSDEPGAGDDDNND